MTPRPAVTPEGSEPQPPTIEGWSVSASEDGTTWTAHRRSGLSPQQLYYGCRLVVGASCFSELELATTAEDMKASMVAMAERLADRMAEADQWRERDAAREGCCDD